MSIITLLLILFIGLFILLGAILGYTFKKNNKIADFSISAAFGVIMTFIAISLIPDILEISLEYLGIGKGVLISSILAFLGFIILQQLDLFIPHHEEKNKHHNHKCYDEHLKHIGIITSIVLIIHNIINGMNLYIITNSSIKIGLLSGFGIGLQNISMGLLITSAFINTLDKKKTIIISLIISFFTFLGGLITFISGLDSELIMCLLFAVSLGMFVYIGFCELLELVFKMEDKNSKFMGVAAGIIIVIISVIFG